MKGLFSGNCRTIVLQHLFKLSLFYWPFAPQKGFRDYSGLNFCHAVINSCGLIFTSSEQTLLIMKSMRAVYKSTSEIQADDL